MGLIISFLHIHDFMDGKPQKVDLYSLDSLMFIPCQITTIEEEYTDLV